MDGGHGGHRYGKVGRTQAPRNITRSNSNMNSVEKNKKLGLDNVIYTR